MIKSNFFVSVQCPRHGFSVIKFTCALFSMPPLQNCLSECVYKCSGGVINSACFIPLRIMALHRDGLRPEERAQSSKIVPTASRSARREREAEECCKFSSETVGLWSD